MRTFAFHSAAASIARRLLTVLATATPLVAAPADAQPALPRVTVAAHAGTAYPVGAFGDVATSGVRVAAAVTIGLMPSLGVYAGYANTGLLTRAQESDVADRGLAGGVALAVPVSARGTRLVARVGAIYNRLRTDAAGGRPADDAGPALGVEAAVGWPLPLGRGRAALTPALRAQSYRPGAGRPRVSHVGLDVGLEYRSRGR